MSTNDTFSEPTPFFPPSIQDIHSISHVLYVTLAGTFVLPVFETQNSIHHHHLLLPINTWTKWLVQCSKVSPLHQVLLNHHSIPQLMIMMIWVGPLSLNTHSTHNPHSIFIIFLATTSCVLRIFFVFFTSSASSIVIHKNVVEPLDHLGGQKYTIFKM